MMSNAFSQEATPDQKHVKIQQGGGENAAEKVEGKIVTLKNLVVVWEASLFTFMLIKDEHEP